MYINHVVKIIRIVMILLGVLLLASCAGPATLSPTPLPVLLGPTELPASIYQPTNAEGYNLPINLSNVVLTCLPENEFKVEFDYQPVDLTIGSAQDVNSTRTSLNCIYPVPGHGICSGVIDFPAEGVTSLVFCHASQTTDRACGIQALNKALCIVENIP